MLRYAALFIATTGFTGFLPALFKRPGAGAGTIGAFVALVAQYMLWYNHISAVTMAHFTVIAFFIGVFSVVFAEDLMREKWASGRRNHRGEVVMHDFNEINLDEVFGQFVAGIPVWHLAQNNRAAWLGLLVSFIAFRLFDTLKPGPVKIAEKAHPPAFAVMLDDGVAGLFAALVTTIFLLCYIYG